MTWDWLIIPAIERFEPELIVVACGYDANAVDPLARMLLHSESFRAMTQRMRDLADRVCGGRLVLVHEGGYSESYVPFCGLATLEALSGVRTDVIDPMLEFIQAQQPNPQACAFQRGLLDTLTLQLA